MANDADLRNLTRTVKSLEGAVKDLTRALYNVGSDLGELLKGVKEAKGQEGTHFKVDEAYLRNQPPEQWVDPEEQHGN